MSMTNDGAEITDATPHVDVRAVSRVFHDRRRGEVRAVESVSFVVPRGVFVAIRGPSGCGKTTLLRLVAALDRPDAGDVVLDGKPYSAASAGELTLVRRRIGLVFQDPVLIPRMSVWENVAYPLIPRGHSRRARRAAADAALERVGISGLTEARADRLSGGERQRVGLARALVTGPELVVADEPTAHLDARAAAHVRGVLENLTPAITVIVATHDGELARAADTVLRLDGGRVATG